MVITGRIEEQKYIAGVVSEGVRLKGNVSEAYSILGKIGNVCKLKGKIKETLGFNGFMKEPSSLKGSATYSISHGDIIVYDGKYEVIPSTENQILSTKFKKLMENITVHATPFSEVSNEAGGYTITIL